VNAAGSSAANSASGALLLDLQVDGVSQFNVGKSGDIIGANNFTISSTGSITGKIKFTSSFGPGTGLVLGTYNGSNVAGFYFSNSTGNTIAVAATGAFGFCPNSAINAEADTILRRDAANTLALRNSTAAQTFRVYNTYTDASNYEFGSFNWVDLANEFQISTGQAGTGTSRALCLRSAGGINFRIGGAPGTLVWQFGSTTGHLLAATDNSVDIGASGANRPRNVYVAQTVKANAFQLNGLSHVYSTVNGNIGLYDNNLASFNLLQFGGTTASFPALKRSTTYLQARLADDSAFAPIQGKLTTDTAFTSGAITDTGYIVLYDSTGAAYKVACTPV
jgi:hypothetical protein